MKESGLSKSFNREICFLRSTLQLLHRQVEGSCSRSGHVGEEENYRSDLDLNTNLYIDFCYT
jgi:hypothetical protein